MMPHLAVNLAYMFSLYVNITFNNFYGIENSYENYILFMAQK